MRLRRLPAVLLAGALAALPAAALAPALSASAAPAAGPVYGSTTKVYSIPSDEDRDPSTPPVDLYLEVVHPTLDGKIVRAPVVLTVSPYSILGRNGDASRWTPRGIARAYVDVIGTGNSGGCYDYGGLRERRTAYDAVEYVGTQDWSTGKVGMTGGSYDGTTQYAAAIEHPPHLTTIVPNVAINRWYSYAYSGGIRYTDTNEDLGPEGAGAATDEGFDTPLAFDFGFAAAPPLDAGPGYQSRVLSTIRPCDEVAHTQRGYDTLPKYDAFWQQRDYVPGLASVDIPVLITGNWGDWNVKQENGFEAYQALVAGGNTQTRLYLGTRWRGHGSPAAQPASGPARESYSSTVQRWMEHYLLEVDNGIGTGGPTDLPPVTTQTADGTGALLPYAAGPAPATTPVSLIAGRTEGAAYPFTLGPAPSPGTGVPASFQITGTNTESSAAAAYRAGGKYVAFETPPLARDVHIFGRPTLRLFSTVNRQWVTLTPSLLDVDPARYTGTGAATATTSAAGVVAATRAWRDTRVSNDGRTDTPLRTPGVGVSDQVDLKPTDYIFRAGHRIVLLVQTETVEWAIAKPPPACTTPTTTDPTCTLFTVGYQQGQTSLTLPVVGGTSAADFFAPQPAASVPEVPLPVLLPLLGALTALAMGGLARRRRRA